MSDLIHWIMAEQKYNAESFISVIDQFTDSLDQLLQTYKLLAGRIGCFGCLPMLGYNN